ncbi:hypothetical protein ACUN0C_18635 [Faunimonas sp. B44]|uniref:hypothetical protein n=1 Tax=Faunimonas sp. B44 TaxID=3461493 RepID=UPI004043A5D2
MTDRPDPIAEAYQKLRRLQFLHGAKVTPALSIWFGQKWDRALKIDPEGSQLKYVLEEIEELLK